MGQGNTVFTKEVAILQFVNMSRSMIHVGGLWFIINLFSHIPALAHCKGIVFTLPLCACVVTKLDADERQSSPKPVFDLAHRLSEDAYHWSRTGHLWCMEMECDHHLVGHNSVLVLTEVGGRVEAGEDESDEER